MKKKIAILGSTGSIGKSTLDVIKENKRDFDVVLLTANNNYKKLIQQAREFKVKNIQIKNKKFYHKIKSSFRNTKTRVFSGDIKLTWKFKLDKQNVIVIKTKFQPIGKEYPFTYQLKEKFFETIN